MGTIHDGVFKQCDANKWKYMTRFKEGSTKSVAREFQDIKAIEDLPGDRCWVNDITYQQRTLNALESKFDDGQKTKTLTFITNIKVANRNTGNLVHAGKAGGKLAKYP